MHSSWTSSSLSALRLFYLACSVLWVMMTSDVSGVKMCLIAAGYEEHYLSCWCWARVECVCFLTLGIWLLLGLGLIIALRDIQTKPTCTPEDRSLASQATYLKLNHHHRRWRGPQLLKVLKGLSWAGRCGNRKQRLLKLVLEHNMLLVLERWEVRKRGRKTEMTCFSLGIIFSISTSVRRWTVFP